MNRAAPFLGFFTLVAALSVSACQPIRAEPIERRAIVSREPDLATTHRNAALFASSKYNNVSVYTIEETENEGRSLLHVSYPVTEHEAINAHMQGTAYEFIEEYRAAVEDIEAAYREYRRNEGRERAALVVSYRQHFDVSAADASTVFFVVSRSRYVGGWGDERAQGYIFDRESGQEMVISDLFRDDRYLQRLSDLTRSALENRARSAIAKIDMGSEAARARLLALSFQWIRAATAPTRETFDDIVFEEGGTMRIRFDDYQAEPGLEGVVEVEVAFAEVADLMRSDVRQLLAWRAPVESPFPRPALSGRGAGRPVKKELQGLSEGQSCLEVPCVALTFDDGPSIYTDGLLDILKEYEVRATFFVVGQSARIHAETIRRMNEEGHQIGNHTWNHPDLTELSDDLIHEQIERTDSIISQIIGETTPHMRPPYAAYNDHVLAVSGMPFILWSVDPMDWKDRDPEVIAARIIGSPAGAIILAHDIHRTTVEAVPAIVESLKSKGIRFVTVTELLGPQALESGHTYFRQAGRE